MSHVVKRGTTAAEEEQWHCAAKRRTSHWVVQGRAVFTDGWMGRRVTTATTLCAETVWAVVAPLHERLDALDVETMILARGDGGQPLSVRELLRADGALVALQVALQTR